MQRRAHEYHSGDFVNKISTSSGVVINFKMLPSKKSVGIAGGVVGIVGTPFPGCEGLEI